MVLGQHRLVGFKVLRIFYVNCGYSVQTSAESKTDRSVVLIVMSGLDHHMINKLKDEINRGLVKLNELGVVCIKVFLSGLVRTYT
jgi:hypothetical protein